MSILTETDLHERYDEMLDEVHGGTDGTVNICGFDYAPSTALLRVDPIAYRTGFSDWLDAENGETIWEMPNGEYTDDEDDLNRTACDGCGDLTDPEDLHRGLCDSCAHNARRSGWDG